MTTKKRKTSYKEASAEQIEKWAIAAVADFDAEQNLALVSLLREFSKYAAHHRDAIEGVVNTALYAAFKESTGLHDDAIKAVVGEGSTSSA
jgi:class 3 adenylate cyclase